MLAALDVRRFIIDWWADAEWALGDVPHAVAGAIATNAYAPERMTHDLAMVVVAADEPRAATTLRAAGWQRIGSLAGVRGSSWKDAAGHALDLIELSEPWAAEALAEAQTNVILGMPTLTLPYLVWMKLSAARAVDLGDLSRMLGRASDDQVAEARSVVRRLGTSDDTADFNQLVQLERLERAGGNESGLEGQA